MACSLWQGRFGSVAMDEAHLHHCFRYVALNPVRARLVRQAEDWHWSSTGALLSGKDDHVVKVAPALERVGEFRAFLGQEFDEAASYGALRKAETIGRPVARSPGRPVGSADWQAK